VDQEPQLIGIGQVAERLNCSTSNIRKLERLGRLLPAMRVSGRRIFRVEDVDAFRERLERQRTKAA